MLKLYVKTALRNLWKNKTFTSLNIVGLAIGICCAGLIFLWVENERAYDQVHTKKDRLYRVNVNGTFDGNTYTMASTPRPLVASLLNDVPGVVNAARFSDESQQSLFRVGENSIYLRGKLADAAIFKMFSFHFKQGKAQNAFTQLYSLVITESTAKKLFGLENDVVGKTVRVNNAHDYIVSGVVQDMPSNSTIQFEWLAPYDINLLDHDAQDWGSFGPYTYVELSDKADLATIDKSLKSIFKSKTEGKKDAFLWPMSQWRLYEDFSNGKPTGGGRIKEVRLLSVIAWIILSIACINFMNLATANSHRRAKEVGIHKTLGAQKHKLVFQFMGEALLMSLLATLVAALLIQLSLPLFNEFMQNQLVADFTNPKHIGGLLGIALICGLAAGSYPSLYLSSFKPALVLKGLKLKTGNAVLIRKGLVVLQFTISIIFICGTIVVYQQLQHVKNRELGLNKDNLVEIDMQQDMTKKFPAIKQELLNTGLFENAALSDHSTLAGGDTDDRFRWQGKPENQQVSIAFRNVSPGFINTSGMKIIAGRDFTNDAAAETNNIIISESFAKLMGDASAVGKIVQSPRGNEEGVYTNCRVIGVVHDYVYGNMFAYSGPVLLYCQQPGKAELLYARLRPSVNAANAIASITAIMKVHNPDYPLTYKFVDDQFNAKFQYEMLTGKMAGVFSILAIIISCLGLFGLAAYTAAQRTKEIGIRKVLGASVAGLSGLLSKEFLRLVIIACVIAFPVAWWLMSGWLQNYQYRIGINIWIFLLAGATALIIAMATVSYQAIKAALVNPVTSLRDL
jgi:putative ABC transport system permease protein